MTNKILFKDENDFNEDERENVENAESEDEDMSDEMDEDEHEEESDEEEDKDNVLIAKSKILLIKKLLGNIKDNSDKLSDLLAPLLTAEEEERISLGQIGEEGFKREEKEGERIIEGVFDGESMIGPDGKVYSVPANYASKSKLVEGDILKLTITENGTFIYKQIGPIERGRIVGKLEKEADGSYFVTLDGKKWRVLTASVTYFKGDEGDEVVILVPKAGESKWGAVENIIKNPE